jgi:oligopeptide transport system substrate-binding protein
MAPSMRSPLLAGLACLVVVVASCARDVPEPSPPGALEPAPSAGVPASARVELAPDQVLRLDLPADPETLDPTFAGDPASLDIVRALQRPLVDLDANLDVVPAMAASWDISDDARALAFHLRAARYSHGQPVLARDFVYSWRRLADPRVASPNAYLMADVAGGADLLAMAGADPAPAAATIEAALDRLGVAAPDDHTLVVHLRAPASYFLSALTLWVFGPIQESWITRPGATEAANYVSSGPFQLDTWDHDQRIVLKPNPFWWGVKPTLREIEYSMPADPGQAQLAYEAGEIDMVATPSEAVQRVRSDPILGRGYRTIGRLGIDYYAFNDHQDGPPRSNAKPGPTANRDFRIALTEAIDKRAFIDATYGGLGRVANSFIMPGIPGYEADLNPYPFDLAAARQHMDRALSELGAHSADELGKLKLGYRSGVGEEPRVAFLAEAWRTAFGLQTEQIGGDLHVFLAERQAGVYDIARAGWDADYPNANDQLNGVFTCVPGGNASHYCNPAFDALVAQAAGELDVSAQVATYDAAQTLLVDDAAFLPLRFRELPFEVQPYVSGLIVTPSDLLVPGDRFLESVRMLAH